MTILTTTFNRLRLARYGRAPGSNEGYDKEPNNGVLARIVNEFEGQHRFGGGDDGDSDPNFLDCLAGKAKGSDDEKSAQATMLKFDAKAKKKPVLSMVRL